MDSNPPSRKSGGRASPGRGIGEVANRGGSRSRSRGKVSMPEDRGGKSNPSFQVHREDGGEDSLPRRLPSTPRPTSAFHGSPNPKRTPSNLFPRHLERKKEQYGPTETPRGSSQNERYACMAIHTKHGLWKQPRPHCQGLSLGLQRAAIGSQLDALNESQLLDHFLGNDAWSRLSLS